MLGVGPPVLNRQAERRCWAFWSVRWLEVDGGKAGLILGSFTSTMLTFLELYQLVSSVAISPLLPLRMPGDGVVEWSKIGEPWRGRRRRRRKASLAADRPTREQQQQQRPPRLFRSAAAPQVSVTPGAWRAAAHHTHITRTKLHASISLSQGHRCHRPIRIQIVECEVA